MVNVGSSDGMMQYSYLGNSVILTFFGMVRENVTQTQR